MTRLWASPQDRAGPAAVVRALVRLRTMLPGQLETTISQGDNRTTLGPY